MGEQPIKDGECDWKRWSSTVSPVASLQISLTPEREQQIREWGKKRGKRIGGESQADGEAYTEKMKEFTILESYHDI